MIELLNQGWFGSLVGIIGIIIGFILYRISKIGARPICQMRGIHVIGEVEQEYPPEIQILFQGRNIPRLTYTAIYLWNSGKQTVRGSDIVADDPIRFEFAWEDEIFKVEVEICTRKVNKLIASVPANAKNQATIMFDFLDPQDGVRIGILHSSKCIRPKILGTIRGIPRGVTEVQHFEKDLLETLLNHISPELELKVTHALSLIANTMLLPFGSLFFLIGILPREWLFVVLQHSMPKLFVVLSSGVMIYLHNVLLIVGTYLLLVSYVVLKHGRRPYPALFDSDIADNNKECNNPLRGT